MQNLIPLGTGNSRFMKSNISPSTTLEQLIQMLNNGTFPYDIGQMNPAGISQQGTPLNKDTLLQDAVAALYGLQNTAVPNDVFNILSGAALFRTGYTQNTLDNWTKTTNVGSSRNNRFAFNGKVAVASDVGSSVSFVSYDKGKTWSIIDELSGPYTFAVNGDTIYAISANSTSVYYTTDGADWTEKTYSGRPSSTRRAWFYDGILCTLSSDYKTIWSSNGKFDGVLPYAASSACEALIVDSTVYFVPASGNQLMYTDDGKIWNARTLPASVSWGAISYKNGVFLAVCSSGDYLTYWSTDATNWTAGPSRSAYEASIITGQNYFILPNAKMYSPDGQTWFSYTANNFPSSYNFFGSAFDDVIFIANYNLPHDLYWATEEEVIPPALTDVQGNPLVLSNAKLTYGSYVGSGTYGEDNPTQIKLDDDPMFICVISSGGFGVHLYGPSGLILWMPGVETQSMEYDGSYSTYIRYSYDPETKIFKYWSDNPTGRNSAAAQLNSVGALYSYAALSVG